MTSDWIVYPPPDPLSHVTNGAVYIRSKSKKDMGRRGHFVKLSDEEETTESAKKKSAAKQNEGKIRRRTSRRLVVNVLKDKNNRNVADAAFYTATFRPASIIPIYDTRTRNKIILTECTDQYRKLAASQLLENDHVLEIGCSNGECSLYIDKYLQRGTFIGFDISQKMIAEAKDKFSGRDGIPIPTKLEWDEKAELWRQCQCGDDNYVKFHIIDPFTEPQRAYKYATTIDSRNEDGNMKEVEIKPTVIFIDIGGNRELDPVVRMISWAKEKFDPRLCIIKSEAMMQNLNECQEKYRQSGGLGEGKESKLKRQKLDNEQKSRANVSVEKNGVVVNGEGWFQNIVENPTDVSDTRTAGVRCNPCTAPGFIHPLKAPLSLSPITNLPICRFHNYAEKGCKKKDACPFDHIHCHLCKKPGHRALDCKQ
jgi:SAM-dependent methyltransferase